MHYDQYITKSDFMNWFKKYHSEAHKEYFRLHQELELKKWKNQTENRYFVRLEIEQLEKELSNYVERYYNQYDYETTKSLPQQYVAIIKLDRPEPKDTQKGFGAKPTKTKINWGTDTKVRNIDTNSITLNFTINGKDYQLEYIKGVKTERDRTKRKKIAMKKNKDGCLEPTFYTQTPKPVLVENRHIKKHSDGNVSLEHYKLAAKETMVTIHYIHLHSTSEDPKTKRKITLSQIASKKEQNEWKHQTTMTNQTIIQKLNKFIEDNNL